ncbi:FAD-dependent oxidoreductase [Nonomuraea sp. NPDC050643]|uniref:NAD(P)/FAD-dependent oxidoreductase n=1 Tax=Nonomuraea sp. NPDC050643 TaxID=3155660 RepID=UPI0033DE53C7
MQTSAHHVVVVGAGILGTALARQLALRGARVTVLDREAPAAGATSVSFGWLTNQTYFRNGDSLPDTSSRHYFGLHRFALGAWRALHHALGDSLGVRWHGAVQLAPARGADRDLLESDLARRLAWGSPSYRVDATQARALLPGAVVADGTTGFHTPDEGSADPNAAVAALVEAGRKLGVRYVTGTEVRAVEGDGGRASAVVTGDGRIACDDVVITCGADSPALLEPLGIQVPLAESYGSIVHLTAVPLFLGPVLLSSDIHAIQRTDGRVVVARHYSGSPVGDPDGLDSERLHADAVAVLPALRAAAIEKVTVGRRIVPADGLPVIGHSPRYANVRSVTTD